MTQREIITEQSGIRRTASQGRRGAHLRSSILPINGLRHPPEKDTTGRCIWAGEGNPSLDPDYFVPLHLEHLRDWRPEILKFLGLPPGWRLLTDGTRDDVWEDPTLLGI